MSRLLPSATLSTTPTNPRLINISLFVWNAVRGVFFHQMARCLSSSLDGSRCITSSRTFPRERVQHRGLAYVELGARGRYCVRASMLRSNGQRWCIHNSRPNHISTNHTQLTPHATSPLPFPTPPVLISQHSLHASEPLVVSPHDGGDESARVTTSWGLRRGYGHDGSC